MSGPGEAAGRLASPVPLLIGENSLMMRRQGEHEPGDRIGRGSRSLCVIDPNARGAPRGRRRTRLGAFGGRARCGALRACRGSRVKRHPTTEEQHEHPCPLYRSAGNVSREVRRDDAHY